MVAASSIPGPTILSLQNPSVSNEPTPEGEAPEGSSFTFSESSWESLGVSPSVVESLHAFGYARPTPVQAAALPPALAGRDILCRSKTGTGKTVAFVLPMIEKLTAGTGMPQALVLCPTRELALQVAAEAERLAPARGLRVATVYGGVAIGPQADALAQGYELVVGTPGRVLDHIRRRSFRTEAVRFACLDEADEMLSMGFYEEVTGILDRLPAARQMLLFSATVEESVRALIRKYLKEPEEIFLSTDVRTVEGVTHVLYETTTEYPKPRQLLHVIELESPESGIIFCNTRDDTGVVARFLSRQGLDAEPLSSDLNQRARERVMGRIKRGEIRFLVATDIAARGIDISDLTHVFNYSLPEDPAVYLHRVGRTGRIGKTGTAVSLWSGRELQCRKVLQRTYNIQFIEKPLPSREEALRMFVERHVEELKSVVGQVAYEGYLPMVQELKQREDGDALLAVALRGFFIWHRMEMKRRAAEASGETEEETALLAEPAFRPRTAGDRGGRRGERPRERDQGGRGGGPERGGRGPRPEPAGRGSRGARAPWSDAADSRSAPEAVATPVAPVPPAESAPGAEPAPDPARRRRRRRSRGRGEGPSEGEGSRTGSPPSEVVPPSE